MNDLHQNKQICKICNREKDLEEPSTFLDKDNTCGSCNEPQRIECPKCFNNTLCYGGGQPRKILQKKHSTWYFHCFHNDCDYETDIVFPYPGMCLEDWEDCKIHDHKGASFLPECRECLVKEHSDCEENIGEVNAREKLINESR